ncbi:MAG: hypothetical protein V4713_03645 [Pseudomonadota bacterium]
MSQAINYTTELVRLVKFTGMTATAIRMYSAYNRHGYSSGDFGAKQAAPARSAVDLMFLADALHHFERIANAVESGNTENIVSTCDELLTIYENYEIENPRFADRQSKPTFELWADLVNLNEVKQALSGIQRKASELASV